MLRTYSEVVARALIVEREQLEVQKERNKNSRFGDFRSRDKRAKRPKMNGPAVAHATGTSLLGHSWGHGAPYVL